MTKKDLNLIRIKYRSESGMTKIVFWAGFGIGIGIKGGLRNTLIPNQDQNPDPVELYQLYSAP